MSSKTKFEKYYEKMLPLLHEISASSVEFQIQVEEKKVYKIQFSYSLFHSSMFINDCEIYIYKRDEKITFNTSNITEFRKKNKMNYNELYTLFRKIKKLIKIK